MPTDTAASTTKDPFVEFKAAQREGWKLFVAQELITMPGAATLVNFAGIRAGESVLDVGCGTGVVAVTAACRGATVRGLDLTPALLERARYNSKQAGVSIDWKEGDAEALPYPDQSFDVVVSQFGHMFAPRPSIAISEMLRVLKKGGRIAFSTWPPELFMGRMFSLVGRFLPLPAGAASPVQWGDPQTIRERLGEAVVDLTFDHGRITLPGLCPKQIVGRFEETSAPVTRVAQKLKDEPKQLSEFRSHMERLVETYFVNNRVRQDFLMTRAVKR